MLAPSPRRPANRSRAGFTLIEVLVVIVIISILAAFLLPAINSVRTRAKVAQVKVEIKALESAVATFKSQYGMDPPSSLAIWENPAGTDAALGNGWNTSSPSVYSVDSRSKIRQIWPQFDFTLQRDFDGDGAANKAILLSQGECLVFFLGGILKRPEDINNNGVLDSGEDIDGDGKLGANVKSPGGSILRSACTGFSKNPFNPFASGGGRETAIYEFDTSRFVDLDGDGYPEFVDTLPSQSSPYLYFSSYGGAGYRYNSASPLFEFGLTSSPPLFFPVQPYLQGSGAGATPWNSKSFQIISPGFDHKYGTFGSYSVDTANSDLTGSRDIEADNITNFGQGTLGGK
jgi:prepilin-type N-terminal cleavage/methylation domain-containing protein